MKNVDFNSLLATFQEMLGWFLWPLLIAIVLTTIAFWWLLWKEKSICSKRLMWSELAGIPGGILALVIMAIASASGFSDAGGPIDWFLIGLIFGIGFIGATILVYTIAGWLKMGCTNPPSGQYQDIVKT